MPVPYLCDVRLFLGVSSYSNICRSCSAPDSLGLFVCNLVYFPFLTFNLLTLIFPLLVAFFFVAIVISSFPS